MVAQARKILQTAEKEKRGLTADERQSWDATLQAIESLGRKEGLESYRGSAALSDFDHWVGQPIGPSGAVVALGSTVAGLVFGFGAVFLIAPGPTEIRGQRRWSDYLSGGRRATDTALENQRRREDTAGSRDNASGAVR